jgi:hypothetical protein
MTFLTHTHLSANAATTAVARSMRISPRVAARKTANPLALAGRYVH